MFLVLPSLLKVSKESHDGSMLCMKRIAELLDLKLKEE